MQSAKEMRETAAASEAAAVAREDRLREHVGRQAAVLQEQLDRMAEMAKAVTNKFPQKNICDAWSV